jgi:outer membrane protein TolC
MGMLYFFMWTLSVLALVFPLSAAAQGQGVTLGDSIARALKQNPQLLSLKEELGVSSGRIGEALSYAYPQLDFAFTYAYIPDPPTYSVSPESILQGSNVSRKAGLAGPIGSSVGSLAPGAFGLPTLGTSRVSIGDSHNLIGNVALTQTLYAGGRVLKGIRLAKRVMSATDTALAEGERRIVEAVKNAFLGSIALEEVIAVRQEAIRVISAHVEDARKLYQEGTVPYYDYLRARVRLANEKPPLIEAQNELARTIDLLKRLMGENPDAPVVEPLGKLSYAPVRVGLEEAYALALEGEQRLKRERILVEVRKLAVGIARGEALPTVGAFGSFFFNRPDYWEMDSANHYRDDFGQNAVVGVNISVPLFEGFRVKSRVKQAAHQAIQQRLSVRDYEMELHHELVTTLGNIEEADERILASGSSIWEAKEALRLAQLRYREGAGTHLDVIDAQVNLLAAQLNLIQAVLNHELAKAGLERMIGADAVRAREGSYKSLSVLTQEMGRAYRHPTAKEQQDRTKERNGRGMP